MVEIVGGPELPVPGMTPQELPHTDARAYALMQFRNFLAGLVFRRRAEDGQSVAFQIPKLNIHIYQPDNIVKAATPGFGIISALGMTERYLGPGTIIEDTYGVYGDQTALLKTGIYRETFTLEAWGSKHAERRALVAGVLAAMTQNASSSGLRLKCPSYFGRVATFSDQGHQYVDGDEVVRNRRRALIMINLSIEEVRLVNVNLMREPIFILDVRTQSCVSLDNGVCSPVSSRSVCGC